jgi:uncharacterized protein (UPF0332 family)
MNEHLAEAAKALNKAKDSIEAAEYSMTGGFIPAAVNRAYYATFYCMNALLYTKNVYAKTHQGTKAKFRELFIKEGILEPVFSTYVEKAFNARQQADYDMDADINKEEAYTIIENAKALYAATNSYLLPFLEGNS